MLPFPGNAPKLFVTSTLPVPLNLAAQDGVTREGNIVPVQLNAGVVFVPAVILSNES